jgi:hypothetical protein
MDWTPSEKQLKLVKSLSDGVKIDVFEFATKIFKPRVIAKWGDLTYAEFSRIVRRLMDSQPLSLTKYIELSSKFKLEQVARTFKREFNEDNPLREWRQLKNGHYRILTKSRFINAYRDHPLENTSEYEYGWQESPLCLDGKLYYLKFYDLLVLDYDDLSYEELITKLSPALNSCHFHIYETYNGFHVYLVSSLINHKTSAEFMALLDCDFFYTKLATRNGFKIRLSPKLGRDEKFLERFVGELGTGYLHPDVLPLLEIRKRFLDGKD